MYSGELQRAWGAPGEPGDEDEILDVILSIARTADQAVDWELQVKFVDVSETFSGLLEVMSGSIGMNLPKLAEAAEILNAGLQAWQADPQAPATIDHTIVFELPTKFNERIETELQIIAKEILD
ncbi:MAG: hypothetical protein IE921_01700 [Rhodobacteraceae bacterium]|nr:hypothetical protein [Paracoccaceae bacterium]